MKINRQGKAATLSAEEEQAVLKAMAKTRHSLRDQALFALCLYTGMRRNEARLLNVGDILDEDGGVRGRFSLRAEITKTKKARDIRLLPDPAKALNAYLVDRLMEGDALLDDSPLFLSQHDKRIALSTFSRVFEVAFKKARIKGAATHSMRRTFVTRMAAANVPIKTISVMVGHSNSSTTSGYIDVTEAQMDEALEKMWAYSNAR